MALNVSIPKELADGENRIAIDPLVSNKLTTLGASICLQENAGAKAHFPDQDYQDIRIETSPKAVYENADIILKVRHPSDDEIALLKPGTLLICFLDPYRNTQIIKKLRDAQVTALAVELIPRISRAQSMDALSSQANIAGYKCAIMAANLASGFFPMLTTAAGTIRPAKVVVIGAGVAGLQAIATAKRLGAQVEAYDIRAAAKEQVESLGAKLIDTGVSAEGEGGYARELTDAEKQQQADVLAEHIAKADAVISTAAIPGRPAPKIITHEMVSRMKSGSIIVDMAAETGGNCELTHADELIRHKNGALIYGPLNIASGAPRHASEMYAKNLLNLLSLIIIDGAIQPDWNDEILAGCCVTRGGEITHENLKNIIENS